MNGPTHYRAAEQLLKEAEKASPERKAINAARAQAHATLALAAATLDVAVADVAGPLGEDVTDAWASAMDHEPEVPKKDAPQIW